MSYLLDRGCCISCIAPVPGIAAARAAAVLLLLLLLLRTLQQQKVVVHKKPSDRVVGGAGLQGMWVVGIGNLCMSHGPHAAVPRNPDRKKQRKNNNVRKSRQPMHMYLLVRDNTWAGPWAGPSNPRVGPSNPRAGSRNCRAGPYRARVSWASLPYDGPGRPGPAGIFWKCDGLGRAAAHHIKHWWAGQAQPLAAPPASAHAKPWDL